jgi:multicomponent K+:H+ antiporter subunit F
MTLALTFAVFCFAMGFALNLFHFGVAPTIADRILAVDTMVINAIALTVLIGIATVSTAYFEAALLLALTGFVSTTAFCKYHLRRGIVE